MNKYIIASAILGACFLASCESIDELPPIKDSTSGKSYRIHEPEPMSSQDFAALNAISQEYEAATKK